MEKFDNFLKMGLFFIKMIFPELLLAQLLEVIHLSFIQCMI